VKENRFQSFVFFKFCSYYRSYVAAAVLVELPGAPVQYADTAVGRCNV
jgi:hypothetical protein